MPITPGGPYDLPTDRVTGGGDPADDMNNADAAINDLHTRVAASVPKSLVDAKGDLLVGTADNTVGRLPAGTDGQTIVYDSGEATGMRAADFPGGGGPVFQMAPKPGDYMSPPLLGINALFGPASSGSQYGTPIFITQTFSIDSLSLRVSTNEASTSAKILLYSSDSEGHPATLVADSGALDCSSGAFKTGTFSPVELTPGTYWGFIRTNSPGGSVRFYSINTVAMQQISSSVATPGNNGSSIQADVGSYASPNTTLSAWTGGSPGNFKCPWFLIHRVAA